MARTEQSIRVSAKGEFSQLQRGLKDLQGDLKNVLGEIDKGARKGGIFDEDSLRALDLYKTRLKQSLGEIDREMQRRNAEIDRLTEKMFNSSGKQKTLIDAQIKAREKELDVIRKQLLAIEDMYKRRTTEAGGYEILPSSKRSGTDSGSAMVPAAMSSMFGKAMGVVSTVGKFAMGLAGLSSIVGLGQKAYQLAYERQVESLDLAQRLRGYGFSGNNLSMYNQVSNVGLRDNMGYSARESWAVQDAYTRQAGRLGADGQFDLQKFARGYGLDATQTASTFGSVKQLGGFVQPKEFANMIAGSVSQSGMLPRIHEVMQAHTSLLQNLNTTFKDGSSQQILAYQTVLDRIGNANGMTRLTGQQGAGIIQGLGGIFQPGNDKWKWTGISALQNYDPKKYGGMGLYDLEASFEQGIMNPDNLPAMAKYLKSQSGGNNEVFKRLMQSWLTDGGFGATKGQIDELDKATNGFSAFDEASVKSILGTDSGAKYDAERKDEQGQTILQVDAKFDNALAEVGQKYLLEPITELKSGVTDILDAMNGGKGLPGIWDAVKDSSPLLKGILAAVAVSAGLSLAKGGVDLVKGIGSIIKKGKGGGTGGVVDEVLEGTGDIIKGKTGTHVPSEGEIPIGQNIKGGALTKAEEEALEALSGGNATVKSRLTQIFRSTGDMEAVQHAVSGNATAADIIDMVSNGDEKVAEQLYKHFDETGDIGKVIDKAGELAGKGGASQLAKEAIKDTGKIGGKLGGVAGLLGKAKIPVVGGLIDFGINKFISGQSTGEAATRAVGSGLGGWGGAAAGAAGGAALGSVVPILGTGIGGIIGGILGGVGGGVLGDKAGSGVYDFFTKDKQNKSIEKTSEAAEKLKEFSKTGSISLDNLTMNGLMNLQDMKDKGLIDFNNLSSGGLSTIGEFQTKGNVEITSLSEEGMKQLLELQKSGNLSFGSMEEDTSKRFKDMQEDTSDKMSTIVGEHKGFLGTIGGFFSSIGDWFAKKFGLSGSSDTPINYAGGGDVRKMSGATASTLDNKFGGVLKGQGDAFIAAGEKYGIDPAFLAAVAMHETGNGTSSAARNKNNVGGMMGANGLMSFGSLEEGIEAMASNLKRLYIDQGLVTIEQIQKKYAPVGASNDPSGLNNYWTSGVGKYWTQLGGGNTPTTYSGDYGSVMNNMGDSDIGSFFSGWQGRVTSGFGANRGDHKHGGLDIDGNQGDMLSALAGGKVSFLHMDDGGQYDSDGKKNTRAGGTELGIKMPDGSTYFYSHLSNVNPELLRRWQSGDRNISIGAGDWLGNLGGDPGKAGSGYSTTGSHLHLGYMNSSGVLQDPRRLLNSLDVGDSDIGISEAWDGIGVYNGAGKASRDVKISVDVNLKGDAGKLNNMTAQTLKNLIQQTVAEIERQKLAMNPTARR